MVINPRRIAVVLDKQTRRGAALPLAFMEEVMKEKPQPSETSFRGQSEGIGLRLEGALKKMVGP